VEVFLLVLCSLFFSMIRDNDVITVNRGYSQIRGRYVVTVGLDVIGQNNTNRYIDGIIAVFSI